MSEEPKKPKRVARKRATNTEAKTVKKTATKRKAAAKEEKIKKEESKPNTQLKPQTEPPKAVVFRRHRTLIKRSGKGFSISELKAVGLSLKQALNLKLKVDKRRTTTHEWNVKALKQYLGIKAA
ncbi:MAG: ribosomal protein L13e [Nitrososphaerales archaeon]